MSRVGLLWLAGLLAGCAQLAGLDPTTGPTGIDAAPDSPRDDGGPDAKVCAGGDARITDPQSGACIVLFSTPMPREQARTLCQGLAPGADLAKIDSATKSTQIANLVGTMTDAFVGGNDLVTEGTFVWTDGTPLGLTNWNMGEPNNALGMFEEDCMVVIGSLAGKWDDRPCAPTAAVPNAGAYASVCEY
jgi:hypothetical protein